MYYNNNIISYLFIHHNLYFSRLQIEILRSRLNLAVQIDISSRYTVITVAFENSGIFNRKLKIEKKFKKKLKNIELLSYGNLGHIFKKKSSNFGLS